MAETVKIEEEPVIEALEEAYGNLDDPGKKVQLLDIYTKFSQKDVSNPKQLPVDLVKEGYIDLDSEVEDDLTAEIQKIHIEEFKNDLGYKPIIRIQTDDLTHAEISHRLANQLVQKRGIQPVIHSRDQGEPRIEIRYFDEDTGMWRPGGYSKAKKMAKDILPAKIFSASFTRELKNDLENMSRIPFQEMGAPEGKIAGDNGLVDLETRDVREIKKDDYVLNRVSVEYQKPEVWIAEPQTEEDWKNLGCPIFGKYLEQVVPDQRQRKKLQEFAGYTLMHWSCKYEKALLILGPTDSGKSVFAKTIRRMLGDENVSDHTIQYLANKMWGIGDLAENLANIRNELDTAVISDIGKVKEMISGERMSAARKTKDPYPVWPRAKHIYCANNPPRRKIEDDAFFNRFLTVIFPETLEKEEQDPELIEKITGLKDNGEESEKYEGELSGILNWAIAGLARLENQEGFTGSLSPDNTREIWQNFNNSIQEFKDEFLVKEEGARVPTRAVYEAYRYYAKVQTLNIEQHSTVTSEIKKDNEIGSGPRKVVMKNYQWVEDFEETDGEKSKQCFIGVRLRSGAVEELMELMGEEEE